MTFRPFTTTAIIDANGTRDHVSVSFHDRNAAIDAADRALQCCKDCKRAYVTQTIFRHGRPVSETIYETPPWD